MTQEEKAKAYDEALEKARQLCAYPTTKSFISDLQDLFPELKEPEDEKIRKWCISHFKECINVIKDNDEYKEYLSNKVLAWLEKQESVDEIVSRCKDSWYNEGKIAGMAEGLTDDEKYQQGWHDALEKQGQVKESFISQHENRTCEENGNSLTSEDAIEREVKEDAGGYPYIDATELYDYENDKPLAKAGDRVKVVFIKDK